MDAIRTQTDPLPSTSGIPVPRGPQSPDLVKILWRWKWLPMLGAAIGLTVGYLYYGQQPPQYRASALIQVQSPMRDIPLETFSAQMGLRNRGDELVIIRSQEVLKKAVEVQSSALSQHRRLAGQSTEQLVGWLKGIIDVRMGSSDPSSDILAISVTTDDAELSAIALQAVVAGYEEHVTRKSLNASTEAVKVLNKYNDTYQRRRDDLQRQIDKLRTNPDLLWVENRPMDPASVRVASMEQAVIELDNQKKRLESLLEQVAEARTNDRPIEESLRLIASATSDSLAAPGEYNSIANADKSDLKAFAASVAQYEESQITPIRMRLKLEESTWGPQHPTVSSLRFQLNELLSELDKKKAALAKAQEEAAAMMGTEKVDTPNLEAQLNLAIGALRERLNVYDKERGKYLKEIKDLKPIIQSNANTIANFTLYLAELDTLGKANKEISEALGKLEVSDDFGNKSVTRLEVAKEGYKIGPFMERYLGMGALMGFAAFCGLAYLLELADRSYRSPDEIATDLGMPIIGHLPLATMTRSKRVDEKVDSSIVTLHRNKSSLSEAFRGIRTALFFSSQQGSIKVIQVTSPIPGDGKSTIAANLAVSISQSGRRVCIVDCDFRRPRVAKIFGLREDVGLVQVIGGKVDLKEAIQETSIENLYSVTCGRRPGNPSELLSSEVFQELMSKLRDEFDYVIVDTPPILVVSDPANVASHVDGVILTVRLRRNLKPIAIRASQMLHSINANMIGVVVNGIGVGGNGYGYGGYRYDSYSNSSGYGYGYGYGQSGYGGYGYGATYQYGGYYGGTMIGRDYYADQVPKPVSKKPTSSPS